MPSCNTYHLTWVSLTLGMGYFFTHAKIGLIKDRNVMDLTEPEDIKKRWQEYTEELYKKDLHDPIIMMV